MLPICDDELEVQKESRPFVVVMVMSLSAADDVVVFLPTMSLAGDQSVGEKVLRDVHVQKRRLQSPGGGVLVTGGLGDLQ